MSHARTTAFTIWPAPGGAAPIDRAVVAIELRRWCSRQCGSLITSTRSAREPETGRARDHRRGSFVDGVDVLAVADPTVSATTAHLRDCATVVVTRLATPSDAGAVAATISEGFETYRVWAAADWTPPVVGEGDPERFAGALARPDVWFLVALSDGAIIGHVALSLSTREDPGPPPPGTVFIWELFVRPAWHGRGVATVLMRAAVTEALRRDFSYMRLWTPEGAGRARRFYEREGWTLTGRVHRRSDFGLPTVEYCRSLP